IVQRSYHLACNSTIIIISIAHKASSKSGASMGQESAQTLPAVLLFALSMSASFAFQLAARFSSASRRLGPNAARIARSGVVSVQHPHVAVDRKKERVIVVGDVHGCFDELLELLQKCN